MTAAKTNSPSSAQTLGAVNRLVKEVNVLDINQAEAQYEIGSILSAIKNNRLFELMNYGSFAELVISETAFSAYTGRSYAQLYDRSRDLGYSRDDSIKLIREFGWRKIAQILAKTQSKMSRRAIIKAIASGEFDKYPQRNFTFADDSDIAIVDSVLKDYGMEVYEGRRIGSSDAFLAIIKEVNARKKAAKKRAKAV